MDAVVHAEPGGEDDVDAGDDVDGDVPEVESADHVHEGEHDAGHHHEAQLQVAEHHERHRAHRAQRQAQVAPQLARDDGVRLPGLVDLQNITQMKPGNWKSQLNLYFDPKNRRSVGVICIRIFSIPFFANRLFIHFIHQILNKTEYILYQLTGEVAKALEEMLASWMIVSTLALAGRYSEGGGRDEDIPYWKMSIVR